MAVERRRGLQFVISIYDKFYVITPLLLNVIKVKEGDELNRRMVEFELNSFSIPRRGSIGMSFIRFLPPERSTFYLVFDNVSN